MKKIKFILIVAGLLCMITCRKEGQKRNEFRVKDKSSIGKKLIGGGNSISSIACGVSIGVTKDLQADFGAVGDGVADDSQAFLNAADWINSSWSNTSALELYIPTGIYKVGVQLAPNTSFPYGSGTLTNPSTGPTRLGFDMLKLMNAKNVYIHGDPGLTSQIVYKSGLFYGGMLAPGSPCTFASGCNTCGSASKYATVGNFISLWDCSCITIEDLSIDGNAQHCQLMGCYSNCAASYQLAYDGINIINGSDIEITNTDCKNFGRDGLMTRYTTSNPVNITLTNLNCIANCRQGFSFTAGDNINATNCKFNQTGSIFVNNPGSGMDIEPESGGTCVNSSFTNCEFKDNAFVGMISDRHYPDVDYITFNTCEFSASVPGSWSIWPAGMSHTYFNYCTIRGQFTRVSGISLTDYMRFYQCNITDLDGSFTSPITGWNRYLMNFGAGYPDNHYYVFSACAFNIHHSLLIYTIPGPTSGPQTDERLFEACTFNFDYTDMQSSVAYFGSSVPAVPFMQLGHFVHCTINSNTFNEVSPVTSQPSNNVCYWIGICNGYWIGDDNITANNSFPQNGISGNPWTRITRNPSWPCCNQFSRANF